MGLAVKLSAGAKNNICFEEHLFAIYNFDIKSRNRRYAR